MDWNRVSEETLAVLDFVLHEMRPRIQDTASRIVKCIRDGGKVMICGNGGSAADAQHFAAELVNRFMRDQRPYPAIALTTDTSVLTSVANDYGYEHVFSKQVAALGRKGDILVAISTSGNAANVCAAVREAQRLGLHTIGLTGGSGGTLARLADTVLC
ncbi:MAG TPA: SIS domain-containing protein, partial [Lentisphaerae bacterium]|nr:SIS domain-containing protein [Lentisphaerota bacterium]